jgi:hypothetical protein
MKCAALRRLLADGGAASLAGNQEAENHLVDCAGCYAVLEAMAEVDRLVPELPSLDVADEVVEQLLARPELATREGVDPIPAAGRLARLRAGVGTLSAALVGLRLRARLGALLERSRQVRVRWGVVAVPAVLFVGAVALVTLSSRDAPRDPDTQRLYVVEQVTIDRSAGAKPMEDGMAKLEAEKERFMATPGAGAGQSEGDEIGRREVSVRMGSIPKPSTRKVPIPDPTPDEPEPLHHGRDDKDGYAMFEANVVLGVPAGPPTAAAGGKRDLGFSRDQPAAFASQLGAQAQPSRGAAADAVVVAPPSAREEVMRQNREAQQEVGEYKRKVLELEAQADALRALGDREEAARLREHVNDLTKGLDFSDVDLAPITAEPSPTADAAIAAARAFLAGREAVDGLLFREALGYWANTYVPGDRRSRQLKASLDRAAAAGSGSSLHVAARQITQPFDGPDGAALAVYLHGDRRGVQARERMLVQVGLKGTTRRSGRRPAMNLGLVLDLRGETSPEAATAMRALLTVFAAAADLGDRFSLTVAGRPGGTVLPPGDLRHGPLVVALRELFGDDTAAGPTLSLEEAAAAALATVRADDDPNAPLGSSAVVVVTAQSLGDLTRPLVAMAHQSAVDGVPWSAVGVGSGVNLGELDAVVLAGQGNRRLLTAAADAGPLGARELTAVSRVVARAVRLRIRLAPGVQLVDVIGSERLDERRAQQVRDAESAVDQRLSHNLGIAVDRGLDEEGIQIVVPSFYADDAHVVLLDLVVPGAGPVADVTVRYKDLVHMKNGVTRAHLEVSRSEAAAGPLERNVLTNLIATEVAAGLERTAAALDAGSVGGARQAVAATLDLVRGLVAVVDGLDQNIDLAADLDLLEAYLAALSTLNSSNADQMRLAVDSLRYAARLKILPPPAGDDEPTP